MRYGYEIEVLNRRFDASKSDIQQNINFYFSRYFINPLGDLSTFLYQYELEKLEKISTNYLRIPIDIKFAQEGNRQLWFGITNQGLSPISQQEYILGYIEISPIKFSAQVPTDVKIFCAWPPLYFFFYGMTEHLVNTFENKIYRSGVDADPESLRQIWRRLDNQDYVLAEIYELTKSLRRWALAVQKTGLPMNKDLCDALDGLSRNTTQAGGVKSYLEASLPLIPGILTYKFEFGTEHEIDLDTLFTELKAIWERLRNDLES